MAHPTDTFVEHFYLDSVDDPSIYEGGFGVQGPYLYGQSAWTNLSGIDQGTPYQCVRLRTRAYDGTYSEPVVLCGKDAPHYVVEGSAMLECTPQGLAHDAREAAISHAPGLATRCRSRIRPLRFALFQSCLSTPLRPNDAPIRSPPLTGATRTCPACERWVWCHSSRPAMVGRRLDHSSD